MLRRIQSRSGSRERGFTLIELMVGITLLAILLLIAMPDIQTYFRNSKIRKTAESFAADVMAARIEAIRTNSPVVLALPSSPLGGETSGPAVDVSASESEIRFNGVGATNLATLAVITFKDEQRNPDCELNKAIRCVQVEVSVGGGVRVCEPGRAAVSAADTRVCASGG